MGHASDELPSATDVVQLPRDELAIRLLRLIVHDQQGHLLSRSNATAPGNWPRQLANRSDEPFLRAIGEAWDWLLFHQLVAYTPGGGGGDWAYLTARGQQLAAEADPVRLVQAEVRLGVELHPRLRERVHRQFLLGEYELAVFTAMREVEIRIRQLAGAPDSEIGVPLAQSAFRADGPLADPNLEPGERQATMALFWGALGVFKNPTSHRQVTFDDPTVASEAVLLADLLLRMLDAVAARLGAP